MDKIITQKQIDEIWNLLNKHKIVEVKGILNNLPENKFKEEIKKLIRNSGRSSLVSVSEIEKIVVEYG